jgi:LPPG:FO 2-phospho-L-lactate transferase
MRAKGLSPDSYSTYALYKDILDIFVQDICDPVEVPESIRFDTLMTDGDKSAALAGMLLETVKGMQ